MTTPPAPFDKKMVNDAFWLEEATKIVEGGMSARQAGAKDLITAVGWFWTAYTALAIAGLAVFKDALGFLSTVLLFLPTVLLMWAYWRATKAAQPIDIGSFDPHIPEEIEGVFLEGAKKRAKLLEDAKWTTVVAAISVIPAIAIAAFSAAADRSSELRALVASNGEAKRVLIEGRFPVETTVHLSVVPSTKTGALPRVERLRKTQKTGMLNAGLRVPAADAYEVSAEWTEDDVEHRLTRSIKP
jgi:hypothetical protein